MDDRLASNIASAWELLSEDRGSEAVSLLRSDRHQLACEADFAEIWLALADEFESDEERLRDARLVAQSFADSPPLIWAAANVLVGVAEDRPLDLPSPADGPAHEAAELIRNLLAGNHDVDESLRAQLYVTLGAALRLCSYAHDELVDDAFHRATLINDSDAWTWFNAGIFYKWRGRWAEGVEANRKVLALNPRHEGALWNLAVCATALGDTFAASEAWLALGLENRPGADGLPSMQSIGPIKLRVSLHGAGTSATAHDPATPEDFEHIWVSARSACHGEVVSASLNELPADYGDIVLWDPSPVGYEKAGELQIPMFPLLARLREGTFHRFWFIAEQKRGGLLREIGAALPLDTALYVLDEQVQWLCSECNAVAGHSESEDEAAHHQHHSDPDERHYVMGKLLVPKEAALDQVVAALDARFREADVRFASPELCREAGDKEHAAKCDVLWSELETLRSRELGWPDDSLQPDDGVLVEPVQRGTLLQALAISLIVAVVGGAAIGILEMITGSSDAGAIRVMAVSQVVLFVLAALFLSYRSRHTVCSGCRTALDENNEHCESCGAALYFPPGEDASALVPIGISPENGERESVLTSVVEEDVAEVVN